MRFIRFPLAIAACLSLGATPYGEEEHENHTPNEWFMAQRAWPGAKLDQQQRVASFEQATKFLGETPAIGKAWTFAGPDNVGGRITDIQSSPQKPAVIFVGTANGGVFRSSDAGTTFQPVFESQPSLSIGALAIDPSNPERIWVGTGEANSSGSTYSGTGIYLSTDGGNTWQHKGLLESHHIGRIVIDPHDPRTLYVAALGNLFLPSEERGVYKTTDGGASWQLVHHTSSQAGCADIAIDPANPAVVYAAFWERLHEPSRFVSGGKGSGIYKTTDGGAHWQSLTQGLPVSGTTTGRIGISLAASAPQTLYAIYDDTQQHFNGLYKTTDGGAHWQRTNDGALAGIFAQYGWWFGNVRADPTDANIVYAIGFTTFKSTNGGQSYASMGSGLHVDHHAFFVDPTHPQTVYDGNDGGFFRSTNAGSTWQGPAKMPITQFYSVAVDPQTGSHIFGGAQDNGTVATFTGGTSDWDEVNGGDGFQVQIDPVDAGIVFAEYQNGALSKSTDGGHTFSELEPGAARNNWNSPILIDPVQHNVVYFGGEKLFRSTDSGDSWAAISPDLSQLAENDPLVLGTITAIAIAKVNSKVIYAGTDNGKVWVTQDTGAHWTQINAGLPQRWVTGLAIDPTNAARVIVTVSGYRFGEPLTHVFLSADFGAHWSDIHGNLPEIPVNVVRADPTHTGVFYLGTDAGTYATTDCGAHWQPLGSSGLPLSPVTDLTVDAPRGRIFASTFGRSMYSLDLRDELPAVTQGCQ